MSSTHNETKKSHQTRAPWREWLKKNAITILTILLVIGISVGIFFFRDNIADLKGYGYLGAFLVSLVSNATIILPVPGIIVIFAMGAALPPVLVGLVAGAGSAIGELVGYLLGSSGRRLVENRQTYHRLASWLNRWGSVTVFVFALTPLPFDLLGIVAGILRFPLWKFLLACFAGKALLNIFVAYAGYYGWELVQNIPFMNW